MLLQTAIRKAIQGVRMGFQAPGVLLLLELQLRKFISSRKHSSRQLELSFALNCVRERNVFLNPFIPL